MAINLWVLSRASSELSSWFRFPKSLSAVVWGKKVIDKLIDILSDTLRAAGERAGCGV